MESLCAAAILHEPIRLAEPTTKPASSTTAYNIGNAINRNNYSTTEEKVSPNNPSSIPRTTTTTPDNIYSKPNNNNNNIRIHPTEFRKYLVNLLKSGRSPAADVNEKTKDYNNKTGRHQHRHQHQRKHRVIVKEESDEYHQDSFHTSILRNYNMTARLSSGNNNTTNNTMFSSTNNSSVKMEDNTNNNSMATTCLEVTAATGNDGTGGDAAASSSSAYHKNSNNNNTSASRFPIKKRDSEFSSSPPYCVETNMTRAVSGDPTAANNSPFSQRAEEDAAKSSHKNPSTTTTNSKLNQKNDKPVEVLHKLQIIARFRTQTDCAKYLRATPEAVSYHCSKGGGICNGLTIRPASSSSSEKDDDNNKGYYSLFDNAMELRPKVRPQLAPEAVLILKQWLLHPDHVDNPYPNARECAMLLKKTGLEKGQLKHWFNNARKRILKPLLKGDAAGAAANAANNNSSSSSADKKKKRKTSKSSALLDDDNNDGMSNKKRRMNRSSSAMTGGADISRNDDSTPMMDNNIGNARINNMRDNDNMGDSFSSSRGMNMMGGNSGGMGGMMQSSNEPGPFNSNFCSLSSANPFFDGGNDNNMNNMMSSSSAFSRSFNMRRNEFDQDNNGNNNDDGRSAFRGRGSPSAYFDQQGDVGNGLCGMASMMNNNGNSYSNGASNMTMFPSSRSSPGPAMCFDTSTGNGTRDMVGDFHGNDVDRSSMMGFGGFNAMDSSHMDGFNNGRTAYGASSSFGGDRLMNMFGDRSSMGTMNDRCFEAGSNNYHGMGGVGGGPNNNNMGSSSWIPTNNDNSNRPSFDMMNDGNNFNVHNNGYPQDNFDFCRPLSQHQQQDGDGTPYSSSRPNFTNNQDEQNSASPSNTNNPDRDHATFKQQVAAMAMNEATTAFKEMEEAYMHAKEIMAQVSELNTINPEEDPKVIEANALAKKCHSVAMFKLKVSQRANEEAANAYKRYQRVGGGGGVVGGMNGGGGGMMNFNNDSGFSHLPNL